MSEREMMIRESEGLINTFLGCMSIHSLELLGQVAEEDINLFDMVLEELTKRGVLDEMFDDSEGDDQ